MFILLSFISEGKGLLGPHNYYAVSVSRSCSKVDQSNTCLRDYHGMNITCIHTCRQDFCNCMNRSPPRKMFTKDLQAAGTSEKFRGVLYTAPYESEWDGRDQKPCVGANKYLEETKDKRPPSEEEEDDFWQDYGKKRRNGSETFHASIYILLQLLMMAVILT